MKSKTKDILINIKKHKVIIQDEMFVFIKHKKTCTEPCDCVKNITQYLEDELFVNEGYVVKEN